MEEVLEGEEMPVDNSVYHNKSVIARSEATWRSAFKSADRAWHLTVRSPAME